MTLPCASWYMVSVAARGAFSRIVDEGGSAIVHAQQQESAAAQIAGDGMHHGEREAGGHGRIDGVAAFLEDFEACVGGEVSAR